MIGSLRGIVLERDTAGTSATVLVECAGVGYFVNVTPSTLVDLRPDSEAFLHVHHHIREDAQTLYGFVSRNERRTFEVLIATHGIGPAMALAILSTHSPSALIDIVAAGDLGALTLVPGVGKKTAERLLIELKNRLSIPVIDGGSTSMVGGSAVSEVREALAGLGYADAEIRDALNGISNAADAATMLRDALRVLGARRA